MRSPTSTMKLLLGTIIAFMLALSMGCATKKHVDAGFQRVDENNRQLETTLEETQTRTKENERVIKDQEGRIVNLSDETKAAMQKIESVEKVALGKLLYQITLDSDQVKFKVGKADLNDSGRKELDTLVDQLIRENRNVFIEIQGHTDSTGTEGRNMELGLKRAESVRRYLSDKGIPLHRMSVISYGESNQSPTIKLQPDDRKIAESSCWCSSDIFSYSREDLIMVILKILGFIIFFLIALKLILIVGALLKFVITIIVIAAIIWLARSIFGKNSPGTAG